jgi:DNA-binding NtrC family response regulator
MSEVKRGEILFAQLIGRSAAMRDVIETAEKAARTDANIYIHGENGTGKELIARAIHYSGFRRARPLVTLDCTAIPAGLMENQLFGHVRGAFTGAVEAQPGVFAVAHTGTLFMDEIGELELPLQAKLLRVLQFREFRPLGADRDRHVDVRFIAATSRDLGKCTLDGRFRSDLYYRIAVIHLAVPPLRERPEDIPLLVEHFTRKLALQYNRPPRPLSPRARELFLDHPWPGNVRQLEHAVEQALICARGDVLDLDDFPEMIGTAAAPSAPPTAREDEPAVSALPGFLGQSLSELEEWYITRMLEHFHGNRTRTARFVGLSVRGLQYKLKRFARRSRALAAEPSDQPRRRRSASSAKERTTRSASGGSSPPSAGA